MITEEIVEKTARAAQAKREELIALPLARAWEEIARAALEAAYPLIAAQVLKKAENIVTGLSYERFEYEDIAEAIRALKAKYEVSK